MLRIFKSLQKDLGEKRGFQRLEQFEDIFSQLFMTRNENVTKIRIPIVINCLSQFQSE